MKKSILILVILFSVVKLQAQDYLISFSGNGASTTVETVKVENLTQGKSITLSGAETLHLVSKVTATNPVLDYKDYPLHIYPNPYSDYCTIEFGAKTSGFATIKVYDLIGKEIIALKQLVSVGIQSFKLNGLSDGVYILKVNLLNQSYTAKLINTGKTGSLLSITYIGNIGNLQEISKTKSAEAEQYWQYNTGDRLKFIGTSTKYSTVVMDIPNNSKTLPFTFIECTDADGNNYPIVQIGTQIWMGENLKTTRYNDGVSIPNVTDNVTWIGLTTGAYCWYNNDETAYKSTYGAFYNWYVINTNKLAPKGWHVPTDDEWTALTNYLGGENVAGGKLKETGFAHWIQPNMGATNETGFTGLPGGLRDNGVFYNLGKSIGFWTSTLYPQWNTALSRTLGSDINLVYLGNPRARENGISVRCILSPFIISSSAVSNISQESASCGGNIVSDGGVPVITRGCCWSTSPNPTIANSKTTDGSGMGNFISNLSGLSANTQYYIRAYATNNLETFYGDEIIFSTLPPPLVSIEVKANTTKIKPWESAQLTATGYDVQGNSFIIKNCKWQSSDSTCISVNQDGLITSNLLGSAKISAMANGIKGSIDMVVDIDNNIFVSKNILLDSLGSWAETSVAVNPKNSLNIVASANWVNFYSFDGGRTWGRTGGSGYFSVDPNVCFLGNGTMLRQGLIGDTISRGIMIQRSLDGGLSFLKENAVWAYKPQKNKGAADQGIMCVDTSSNSPYNGSVYVITSDYPAETPDYVQIGFSLIVIVSRDGGKTWLEPVDISTNPDKSQEHSSYITTGSNGEVYAAWWNLKNQVVFNRSLDGGITWDEEKIIHTNIRSDQFVLTDDVRGNITIDVDRGTSSYKGRIYISGADHNGSSGGATDAWLVNSSDGGNSWSDIVLMSDGLRGAFKYYFQPRISVAPNGRIDAV